MVAGPWVAGILRTAPKRNRKKALKLLFWLAARSTQRAFASRGLLPVLKDTWREAMKAHPYYAGLPEPEVLESIVRSRPKTKYFRRLELSIAT